jgi:hypothetical protein
MATRRCSGKISDVRLKILKTELYLNIFSDGYATFEVKRIFLARRNVALSGA